MKIDRVIYFKTFPLGSYWEKIGMEAALSPEEDAVNAIDILRKEVERSFQEAHPNNGQVTVVKTIEEDQPKKSAEEKMIEQIEQIKEVKVLESFSLLAKNNAKIKEAYDNRLKQLTA